MDELFWAEEAARLYKEGHTVKETMKIVQAKKEEYERSKSCVEENMVTGAGKIPNK